MCISLGYLSVVTFSERQIYVNLLYFKLKAMPASKPGIVYGTVAKCLPRPRSTFFGRKVITSVIHNSLGRRGGGAVFLVLFLHPPPKLLDGGFLGFLKYLIQYCIIFCHPPEDAGIKPWTIAALALAVRRPQTTRLNLSRLSLLTLASWQLPSKSVISSLTYNFVIILKKNLGTPARLSLTATDFTQKQSDHDIFFSFKARSYKIWLV